MNDCPHLDESVCCTLVFIFIYLFIRSLPGVPASRSIDDSGDENERLMQDTPVRSIIRGRLGVQQLYRDLG